MMAVIRYLFVLLIGYLAGMTSTGWFLSSGSADFLIKKTEVVEDLQRRLGEVEQERDRLGRHLEDVEGRAKRMEAAFTDMETRFRSLSRLAASPPAPAPTPAPPHAPPARATVPGGGDAPAPDTAAADPPPADTDAPDGDVQDEGGAPDAGDGAAPAETP